MRLTERAHTIVAAALRAGDVAIDATAGNGHDTVFLAGAVGSGGQVFALDIQAAAIAACAQRLRALPPAVAARVHLLAGSHAQLHRHLPAALHGQVGCVMFNLGYLPGADRAVVTLAASTVAAVTAASGLLRPGGVMTIVAYPGHDGGRDEVAALDVHVRDAPDPLLEWEYPPRAGPADTTPRLYLARKRARA